MTLVELLVTITILVILVGVTIPLMRSIRNGSQLEAAVRKIESMMNTAKAIAITNGRPAGLVFVRDELDPTVAYEVAVAESPAPYSGEVAGTRAQMIPQGLQFLSSSHTQAGQYGFVRPLRLAKTSNDMVHASNDQTKWFVRPGDEIRLNFQGKRYQIAGLTNEYLLTFTEPPADYLLGNWFEFQIFRAPRRTMAAPVELPQGAFVKLSMSEAELQQAVSNGITPNVGSGMSKDRSGVFLDPSRRLFTQGDVMLTFNPSGRLDRIFRGILRPADEDAANGAQNSNLDPELIAWQPSVRVTGPIRIDLGDGSPAAPTNAHRYMLNNRSDRSSKTIAAANLSPNFAAN